MIKKICLIILISMIMLSCGKKDDPVYKGQKIKSSKNQSLLV